MECYVKIYLFILFGVSLVASFSWKDCSKTTDPIKIMSIDINSIQNKTMYVSGKVKVARNITGPIRAVVNMEKKFFWGWTPIPCVDNLGSCTYDDICELDPYKDKPCPLVFIAHDLPCRCPIPQGQFQDKNVPLDLNFLPQWLERGKYRIEFTLYKEEEELMCILMYIQF